jgi:PKHD-type hydroxylase
MFLEVQGVLTKDEVTRLRQIADEAPFVDGRISNPHNTAKSNMQADMTSQHYAESSKIASAALARTREFRDFAFPKRFGPPLLTRYQPNMKYGPHFDSAYITAQNQTFRSDVSATIFISDPSTYQGGELVIHMGARSIAFKGAPGSAIFYPSTTLHEVAPVRSGERLVAITFVQSLVPDEHKRNQLYELNEIAALEGESMSWENRTRLEGVRSNLLRMWSSN